MAQAITPRGPYRIGVKRRQQIIDAATVAFARRGYSGASLRQIAQEVGVTGPGLLRHFANKEDLLMAVLDRWTEDTDKLVHKDRVGLDMILQYPDLMRYHEAHPGLIELYLTLCGEASDPAHPARPWITKRYERLVDDGLRHLKAARDNGEIKAMSDEELEREIRGLYGLMDGLELQWIANPSLDLTATFEGLFAVIVARWRGAVPTLDDVGTRKKQSAPARRRSDRLPTATGSRQRVESPPA